MSEIRQFKAQTPFSGFGLNIRVFNEAQLDSQRPLVAIHGWLDNGLSFKPLAAELPEYPIIAVDLPGHGLSDHLPVGSTYEFVAFMKLMGEFLGYGPYESFDLMGHSLGAGIASLIAPVLGERIGKLILVEGFGPLTKKPEEGPEQLKKHLQMVARVDRSKLPRPYPDLEMAAKVRKSAGAIGLNAARILVSGNMRQTEEGFFWTTDPRLKWPSAIMFSEDQCLAYLKAVEQPTLFLKAEESILRMRETLERREQAINDLTIVNCPGAHHMHMDQPVPVAKAIRHFLARP